MDDSKILEAAERFLTGDMTPEEQAGFETLRRTNPEVDQLVVEHTFFLQKIAGYDDTRKFRNILNETHQQLVQAGGIVTPTLQGKAKVIHLFNRYKRTAAIAASIAGVTALCISALIWSVSPVKRADKRDIETLSRDIRLIDNKINLVKNENDALRQQITKLPDNTKTNIEYRSGGTGFLVSTKGFLFTNYHVIENARYVVVQNSNGKELQAKVVYKDADRDIAILRIVDSAYKAPSAIPYGIKKSTADIAEPVFLLGYPRNDIVYGEGYLAAKTGYNGDTLSMQISINANRGNSGSPIINHNGEIIGVLNARQTSAEGAVFAIQSKYIHKALAQLQKSDTAFQQVKVPGSSSLRGADRKLQVKKIMDYVYMVKVN